jgi:hypothetical protein
MRWNANVSAPDNQSIAELLWGCSVKCRGMILHHPKLDSVRSVVEYLNVILNDATRQ